MKLRTIVWILGICSALSVADVLAYDPGIGDCSGLPEWKRQHYYLPGDQVQYLEFAYRNDSEQGSKRDFPTDGYPWTPLGSCINPGDGNGGGGGDGGITQQIDIYGAWHCGNDYCTWGSVRDMDEFDARNHWLIDRNSGACSYKTPGNCQPSVNLVVLSFVHPLRLLHRTTDAQTLNGVPRGITQEVVDYFKDAGIRVMLSIGGITYVEAWNNALEEDAIQLGLNAAAVADALGVGIEIDYEENRNPNLDGLQTFIDAYRSMHSYNAMGTDPAARLTIDLAAGDRWLIALTERATRQWLQTESPGTPGQGPVLDYANAMVTPRKPTAEAAIANWQEHIDGKPQYDPPIPPLAPAKFTGSFWLTGRKPIPECVDFDNSLQHPSATGDYVRTVSPNGAGTTPGMLGIMFWAAECEGTRTICTTLEYRNSCEGGMGEGAAYYEIPIPMPPLRQQ